MAKIITLPTADSRSKAPIIPAPKTIIPKTKKTGIISSIGAIIIPKNVFHLDLYNFHASDNNFVGLAIEGSSV
jgi:hypothetical protein